LISHVSFAVGKHQGKDLYSNVKEKIYSTNYVTNDKTIRLAIGTSKFVMNEVNRIFSKWVWFEAWHTAVFSPNTHARNDAAKSMDAMFNTAMSPFIKNGTLAPKIIAVVIMEELIYKFKYHGKDFIDFIKSANDAMAERGENPSNLAASGGGKGSPNWGKSGNCGVANETNDDSCSMNNVSFGNAGNPSPMTASFDGATPLGKELNMKPMKNIGPDGPCIVQFHGGYGDGADEGIWKDSPKYNLGVDTGLEDIGKAIGKLVQENEKLERTIDNQDKSNIDGSKGQNSLLTYINPTSNNEKSSVEVIPSSNGATIFFDNKKYVGSGGKGDGIAGGFGGIKVGSLYLTNGGGVTFDEHNNVNGFFSTVGIFKTWMPNPNSPDAVTNGFCGGWASRKMASLCVDGSTHDPMANIKGKQCSGAGCDNKKNTDPDPWAMNGYSGCGPEGRPDHRGEYTDPSPNGDPVPSPDDDPSSGNGKCQINPATGLCIKKGPGGPDPINPYAHPAMIGNRIKAVFDNMRANTNVKRL